ncbi:hypothetical protein KFE98_16105 [bacterium SCSIO 12741]|nr:hypothetical protein KFE98_16105 [bacterium SCSIO 12741]
MLLLPVFSLASYWAFLKARYNYFEHLTLNLYITGQQIILYLVVSGISVLIGGDDFYQDIVPMTISMGYIFWVYFQFFRSLHPILRIVLTFTTYLINLILTILLLFLAGIIEALTAAL